MYYSVLTYLSKTSGLPTPESTMLQASISSEPNDIGFPRHITGLYTGRNCNITGPHARVMYCIHLPT